jgi:DNA repair photolyase
MFVRWQSQSVENDSGGRLPGMEGDVVVRHFDAPEALGTSFHEVRTKSALNRVPSGSRVPFEWTVNPYRGCAHACVYCAAGDTRILMADGTHRALADLRAGDEITGTAQGETYRHYVATTVLAHWSSIKPAYRVTLADGTELVASGEHRFLSHRGWKHVTGAQQGAERRPHLTAGSQLIGTGRFSDLPDVGDPGYRRGYLCGLIRGDGTLAVREYQRPSGRPWRHHFFRLALADHEALDRAHEFLADAGVETGRFALQTAGGLRREKRAIRTQARAAVAAIGELIAWPASPADAWCKGFLAGIFDAEGSCDGQALRLANTDPEIIGCTSDCLARFGFDAVHERSSRPNGLVTIRVRGGVRERLRLFHLTAPAISRKLRLVGRALKSNADLRVVAIEPVGTMRLYDITTGTSDFIANGVVSHNCFARPTHEYLDMDAGRDFEREIVVKVNVPEVLRAELAKPSWGGQHVALGTNTDPYQWVEGRYKLMRGVWEAMRDFANPCSILTKSPLVLRDADLLQQIAERTHVSACLSVPTLDERAWRSTEPKTPHPKARLEAVAELNRIGIPTGILIAPLMPGINDAPAQVEKIVELATEAGALHIGGNTLFLRGAVRDIFFEWLEEHRPDLLERYRKLYARGAYVPADERRTIEVAAGAPWARRRYPDRFRHRTRSSADYDPRQNGEFGTLSITPPAAGERPTRSRGTLRLTQAAARGPANGPRKPARDEPPARKEVAPPAQGALF